MRARRSSIATTVSRLLPRIADGKLHSLPVPGRFWDGSVLPADPGRRPASAVVTVSRRAVAHLLHSPGQLGLARAWVDGSLGLEGELEPVLAARNEFDGVSLTPSD